METHQKSKKKIGRMRNKTTVHVKKIERDELTNLAQMREKRQKMMGSKHSSPVLSPLRTIQIDNRSGASGSQ